MQGAERLHLRLLARSGGAQNYTDLPLRPCLRYIVVRPPVTEPCLPPALDPGYESPREYGRLTRCALKLWCVSGIAYAGPGWRGNAL